MMKKNIFITATIFFIFSTSIFAQKGIIINSGAKMELSPGTSLIVGSDLGLINNSTNSAFNGTVVFSGASLQEIGGSESTTFSVLDIDNSNNVSLSANTRITNELILTSGVLDIGDFDLILSDVSSVNGTFSSANMINVDGAGFLIKEVYGNGFFELPIGDLTATADYSPVEFNFTAGIYTHASVLVGVKNEKHSNNPSTTDYLNRYWALSSSGISNFSCDMVFNYVSDDIVGSEANILGAIWNNSSWNNLGQAASLQFSGTGNIFLDVTGVESQFVGIENSLNENISVYYNNGIIFVNSTTDLNLKDIEIYDALGRLVSTKDASNTDLNEIPFTSNTGYYFLKINTDKSYLIKKILIN